MLECARRARLGVIALKEFRKARFVHNDSRESSNEQIEHEKQKRREKWRQWATPEQMDQWSFHPDPKASKFSLFKLREPDLQWIEAVASRKGKLMELWRARFDISSREKQTYEPKRQQVLGPDIGCAYFFCYLEARVKFYNNDTWYTKEKRKPLDLPNKYQKGWLIEKIDCENMVDGGLRYEGVDNFSNLIGLKWLSLKGNKNIDDWALDKLVGNTYKSVEYLDLCNTSVTHLGLVALYKMQKLKVLIIDSTETNKEKEMTFSMLEDANPNLLVKII